MAKNNKTKKNKNNNVAEAPPANPTPGSPPPPPPPPVSPKRAIADPRLYKKMEDEAFAIAATAFKTYDSDARIADEIKKEFDRRYGGTWHCIVGSSYGSCVSCDDGYHFYFYFGLKDIILFKC
ncbi:dynein light chain 1, cytoplasmic-like [Vicia villosa]|uniref:dynein light chain 1, cytoplasmic-like n=1 Tax=Vicia villosa TaxID=3911 RepID=UPI00273A7ED6|nr:dynein light chain 1, cytoplasmic-like [Vicia villosa]